MSRAASAQMGSAATPGMQDLRAFHLNFCAKDRIADWIRNIEVGPGHDRRIMMFQMMLS
jgi:hypothetical protein